MGTVKTSNGRVCASVSCPDFPPWLECGAHGVVGFDTHKINQMQGSLGMRECGFVIRATTRSSLFIVF